METDKKIQENVMEEIKYDPLLDSISSSIGVAVKDGVVTLTGHVETFIQKHAIEEVVKRVKGVSFVAVDIAVTLGVKHRHDDTAIANAIKEAFKHLSVLDYEDLDVTVDEGVVTLEGTLRWDHQRQAAEEYVRNVTGVRSVNNNIELSDEPCDARTVTEKINSAFHRHATLDAANIKVEIAGRKAVLSGKVRSWIEKKDAENVAWSSPGVRTVENKIVVVSPYVR
jgi:osmotically-inducible protein OsmY